MYVSVFVLLQWQEDSGGMNVSPAWSIEVVRLKAVMVSARPRGVTILRGMTHHRQ